MVYRYPFSYFGAGELDRPVRYSRDSWPYDYYTDKAWPIIKGPSDYYVPWSYKDYFYGRWPREFFMDSGSLYSYLRSLRAQGRLYGPLSYPFW